MGSVLLRGRGSGGGRVARASRLLLPTVCLRGQVPLERGHRAQHACRSPARSAVGGRAVSATAIGLLQQTPGRRHGVEGGDRGQEPALVRGERPDLRVRADRGLDRLVAPALQAQGGLGEIEQRRPRGDPFPPQQTRQTATRRTERELGHRPRCSTLAGNSCSWVAVERRSAPRWPEGARRLPASAGWPARAGRGRAARRRWRSCAWRTAPGSMASGAAGMSRVRQGAFVASCSRADGGNDLGKRPAKARRECRSGPPRPASRLCACGGGDPGSQSCAS